MDNTATLNKMHSLQLTLADELKRICDKHGIRYFIFAGSLLGAVRHGGFIPCSARISTALSASAHRSWMNPASFCNPSRPSCAIRSTSPSCA